MPVETTVVVPFSPLSEFAPHEEQFAARMRVHPGVEQPEVGKLLPFVPRHFVNEGAFTVDDLVVAEDQDEMFMVGVEEGEGDFALVEAPVHGLPAHVVQEVVHPAHVPLESKPKAAEV